LRLSNAELGAFIATGFHNPASTAWANRYRVKPNMLNEMLTWAFLGDRSHRFKNGIKALVGHSIFERHEVGGRAT
jgi:hypothetical protein